jgi:hypothetical protein
MFKLPLRSNRSSKDQVLTGGRTSVIRCSLKSSTRARILWGNKTHNTHQILFTNNLRCSPNNKMCNHQMLRNSLKDQRIMFNSSLSIKARMRERRLKWRRRGNTLFNCSNRWLNNNKNLNHPNQTLEGVEVEVFNRISSLRWNPLSSNSNNLLI